MDKFVPSIKKKYKDRLINREKQWPPCHSNKLVKLELVEREKGEGSSANTQRGREDKRTPLAYGDLFKEESGKKAVRKVLVEGDAGIGKTTLSTSISEDWSHDKLFKGYELLLLLPLRHKKVASAGSLPELLQLLHPDEDVRKSVASYLTKGEGEKVVIIADGWDEVSESNRQEGSFLYQLLFETFPLMSVVVTSRPSASGPLHRLPCIDRFVEIKGFSKEDIKEYIKSEFPSDEKKAGDLLEQLESNPLVESVCSVPLNCAIVCHLWRCLEETLPSTMTQLYTKIILNVMFRNIQKSDTFKNILSLSNFNALPKDLQQPFWRLCEFAFQMLKKNQIVFSHEELVEFLPQGLALDDNILCFGLLQSVETVLETGRGVSFHFLHLTFQEFLASLYLSRQPPETQLEVFRVHCSENHFTLIWRFFFGICLCNTKLEVKCNIKQVIRYLHDKSYSVKEPSLCHCAFEAQNDAVSSEVIQLLIASSKSFSTFGRPRTAHDCAAMLYVIANMQECSGMVIYFHNSGVRENQIKTLTDLLASKHGKLQVKGLVLSGNKLTDKCVSDLFHKASAAFQSLTCVNLRGNRIGNEGIKTITSTLAKSSSSGCLLSELGLSHNPLGVSGLQTLESVVRDNLLCKLEYLYLAGSLTSDADTNAAWLTTFVEALSTHCPHLKSLNLSENNLGVPGASALARVISKLHHHSQSNDRLNVGFLSEVYLNTTNLGDKGLCAFVESLECVHHFNWLELSDNGIHATGIASLADAVCSGKVVIEYSGLDLSDNPLRLEGTLAVGRMLSSSHCQPCRVDLSRCKLTTDGGGLPNTDSLNVGINISGETVRDVGQQLCQMPQNNTITWLVLDGNRFTGDGIHILVGFMHLCPCLPYLYSLDCGITSDDVLLLLDKLTQLKSSSPSLCSKLESWYLDNNRIDDSGVYGLINHLPSLFPRLGYSPIEDIGGIYLHGNPVSREVETKLEGECERREEV